MSAVVPPPLKPTTAPASRFTWTREQYHRLGELGFFDGKRVELLYGEIIEMSPINWPHALSVGLVSDALGAAFPTGFYLSVQQPLAVPGSVPGSEPQPDVALIPGSRRNYTGHPDQAALVVEVADSTLAKDTTTKAELYATAGVPDYWVLDLVNRQLLVFRDHALIPDGGAAYRDTKTFGPDDTVAPLAAPHAAVKVADLLP